MAYIPTMTVCESCDGVVITDTTGTYDAVDNPGGYGGPGAPADPSELTSQVLGIWLPNSDHSGDPDITIDLGALPLPTPDADGYYAWTLDLDALGLEEIVSGIWYFRITAVYSAETFLSDVTSLFVLDIQEKIDAQVAKGTPGCGCDTPGQVSKYDLPVTMEATKRLACCGSWMQAQKNIDWLYLHYNLCC